MLELALTWHDVAETAAAVQTCIREGMHNHLKARQDWEKFPGRVEYWLSPHRISYSRVIRLTHLGGVRPLWLLDYCAPFHLDHVVQVAEVLTGWLLVSRSSAYGPGDIVICLPLPALVPPEGLSYIARSLHEQEWVLIECQAKAPCYSRPGDTNVPQPVYDD